jgi:hypothetical protein
MKAEDFQYLIACFRLTSKERTVVLAAVAVLALGAAVKYWRESRPPTQPVQQSVAGQPLKTELKK